MKIFGGRAFRAEAQRGVCLKASVAAAEKKVVGRGEGGYVPITSHHIKAW